MTLAEAVKVWIEAKRVSRDAEAKLKASAAVLKEHFRKTGKNNYKGKIGYALTTYCALDLEAARAALGKKLDPFEVTRERETLSLLKDA